MHRCHALNDTRPRWSRGAAPSRLVALLVSSASMLASVGCAHQVRVDSNVPVAEVRVDGERLGRVEDGAVFTEHGGLWTSYDIEVAAEGYGIQRRRLSPSVTDPWVGIPALGCMIGACSAASCVAPLSTLAALLTDTGPSDDDAQAILYGVAISSVAVAAGSAVIAAWGVDRMPDVVRIDLEPDENVAFEGAMPH